MIQDFRNEPVYQDCIGSYQLMQQKLAEQRNIVEEDLRPRIEEYGREKGLYARMSDI